MMREIKFRQWIPKAKKFHYFGFLCFKNNHFFKSPVTFMFDCEKYMEKYPVSQYSGMKDKKDVEIYEGDIVTGKKRGAPIKGYLKVIDIHWFLHDQEDTFIYFGSVGDLEVIGNIYENPELLGESDEVDKC